MESLPRIERMNVLWSYSKKDINHNHDIPYVTIINSYGGGRHATNYNPNR